jgi:hypothetical protein
VAVPSLRILYDATDGTQDAGARALATRSPSDVSVSLAALGDPPDAEAALGDTPVDQVLLLPHRAAPALREALERRGWRTTLVTLFRSDWPDDLPAFFAAYEVSDAVLVSKRDYWEGTGRLPRAFLAAWSVEDTQPRVAAERSRALFDALRQAGDRPSPGRPPRGPDLSAAVSVFVTSIGAPSYPACRALLDEQDCAVRLEVLEDVRPLSAALQRMLDECKTPYYVQVDEDMLLYPHAIRTLYERMATAGADVAMVIGYLYDVHLRRSIQGVKIFQHEIGGRYPWSAEPSVIRRTQRIEADGHRVVKLPVDDRTVPAGALGLHGTHWTSQAVYERYRGLERLRRRFPDDLGWFQPYGSIFLDRFLAAPSSTEFFAIMGVIAGALAGPDPGGELKDAGRALPGFEALARYLESQRPSGAGDP